MLPAGTLLQRRYRIERLLGEGGMSQVYLATHLGLNRQVAVKMLQQLSQDRSEQWSYVEQFQEEARILAALDHPNLAIIMDLFMDQQLPYLVMEFIDGRNLEAIVELAPRRLSQRKVLEWTAQLLDVLEYLHTRQTPVIVRDLKPANVLLGADSRLRLIDFGLAKLMHPNTRTRAIVQGMGSEGYAPLEQYGRGVTDQRTDIYALGATLYFLLSGKHLTNAPSRVNAPQLGPPPPDNPSVTPPVWSAVERMVAIYPQQRPQSVAEVRTLLGLGADRAHRRCLSCSAELRNVVRAGVQLETCPNCSGVWLERLELEKLLNNAFPQPAPPSPPTGQGSLLPPRAVGKKPPAASPPVGKKPSAAGPTKAEDKRTPLWLQVLEGLLDSGRR